MSCAEHKYTMNGCTDCLSPVGETANATDLKSVEETLVGSTPTLGTKINTTVCKVCTKAFKYEARRGRPPVTCDECIEDLNQKRQAKITRREAKSNARAKAEAALGDTGDHEPAWVTAMRESIRQ